MEKKNNIEFSIYGKNKEKMNISAKKTKTTTKILKIEDKAKTKNAGLRLGAYSIVFSYLGLVSYLNPTHFDFIPYGFAIDNVLLIPETFIILILLIILSIGFSITGSIYAIVKKSLLGFILSFIVLGNTVYLSIIANEIYNKNPSIIHEMTNTPSLFDLTNRIKFVEKGNIKKLFE